MPIPIKLGGVPTGVAIPPTEAPYATINITPVLSFLKSAFASISSKARSIPKAIGKTIAVVAVLETHMETHAEISPTANKMR